MLRTRTKERINSILELQLQLHQQGILRGGEVLAEVLEDCQQAALSIGEQLEQELSEYVDLVSRLEQYCEKLYQISQKPQQKEIIVPQLDMLLIEVKERLAEIPSVYQAVFMPYKAEMWDSLESVWMAFNEDENFETFVIPLPYSQFDAAAQQWNPCYEGNHFPEYVPITDFHAFSLETECPEFIFIHNAYDEYNLVTRINPEYFSVELKKYTKNLVYIPYYLTSGFIAKEHKMLSAYRYMDYMIVQSELFKSGLRGAEFYDRILPLGSPKLDRVIRLCQGEKQIPKEWENIIEDKKCIMLNTSLSYFLHFGEYYLRRVRACIEWIRENPIVALIWRPHPLFESTIRSMRPELLPMYQELVEDFQRSGIGVLDQTPDIAHTVAAVDGYIGDGWTSVINLFGVAGRPMFILDAAKARRCTKEEQRRIAIAGVIEINDRLWITPRDYNGLLCMDGDWDRVQYVCRFEGQPHWSMVSGGMTIKDQTIYFAPIFTASPLCYHMQTGEIRKLNWDGDGRSLNWGVPYIYKDQIFYVSKNEQALGIYKYDMRNKNWTVYEKCLKELVSRRPAGSKEACVTSTCLQEHYIWISAIYTNRILRFDMETCNYEFYSIGPKHYGYAAIRPAGNILYLNEIHGRGRVVEVHLGNKTIQEYPLPKAGKVWKNFSQQELAIGGVYDLGRYLVLLPGYSNRMWRFDKETHEFISLAEEFWEEGAQEGDNYLPQYMGVLEFCCYRGGTTLWVQRVKDNAILIIDAETGNYEVKYLYLAEESYARLMEGEDGFQKLQIDGAFIQTESRHFQFEDFIQKIADGKLEDVKKRQKEELVTLAANMNGTCGEKVHEYFKSLW